MRSDRTPAIRQFLFTHGPSPLTAIAAAVGTSLATLRRDLDALVAAGVVIREHGGARLVQDMAAEVAFEQREFQEIAAKRAIGAAAYDLLIPGSTIFLDAGTTVLQLARRIRVAPMPLSVFTNCLPAAQVLIDVPDVKVTLLGGLLRRENASIVGPLAEAMMENLWFSQLFLGAGAVDSGGQLSSSDESEARMNARMIARSEKRALLVDSTKFGQRQTYAVGPVSAFNCVVTDSALGWDTARRLRAARIDLHIAQVATRAAG
jgi:DeoR family fructose operon transcriptional repressor